ncbi:short-chain dehydrogenase [Escherichia coli]|nr:short-chain dehydrogenase [Escherichia coli]GCX98372.1 short-chain dehydrogenase [Escherichia coli]
MYRVKQLFGGSLTLRDYDGQVAEAMALVRALGNDSNLLIVFYVQIMPDDFVMQLHRF